MRKYSYAVIGMFALAMSTVAVAGSVFQDLDQSANLSADVSTRLTGPNVRQHCVQGYKFVTFQGIGKLSSHQVLNEKGLPEICGFRLTRVEARKKAYTEFLKTYRPEN